MRRSMVLTVAAVICGCASGCANYAAVSRFAGDTTSMTRVVESEFTQLDALCVDQATLVIAVNDIADDRPLATCEQYRRTQGRFATLTVDVLDGYARTLGALADDRPFDLTGDIHGVGAKVRAMKNGAGDTVLSTGQADALVRVSDLLVEVAAAAKRDDAVERMVRATPDLTVLGASLRSFFVVPADAAARAPYANFVAVIASSTGSTRSILQSAPMKRAEPIRTAELSRELRARQAALDRRARDGDGSIPARIAAAIDAWLAALDTFSRDALRPDSHEMRDRFQSLRDAVRVADETVAE